MSKAARRGSAAGAKAGKASKGKVKKATKATKAAKAAKAATEAELKHWETVFRHSEGPPGLYEAQAHIPEVPGVYLGVELTTRGADGGATVSYHVSMFTEAYTYGNRKPICTSRRGVAGVADILLNKVSTWESDGRPDKNLYISELDRDVVPEGIIEVADKVLADHEDAERRSGA